MGDRITHSGGSWASGAPLSQRFALLFGSAAGAADMVRYAVEDFLIVRIDEASTVGLALVNRCGVPTLRCVFYTMHFYTLYFSILLQHLLHLSSGCKGNKYKENNQLSLNIGNNQHMARRLLVFLSFS